MRTHNALCALAALTLAAAASAETHRSRSGVSTVERGPLPANGSDSCAGAPAIAGFGNFPFDNTNATEDGQDHGLCAKDGGAGIGRDLWWRWTSHVTGPVTISTCGLTTVDTEIAIYAPGAVCAPGDAALIFCDDQNCSGQTEITFLAAVGQQYLFRVGSFDGGSGFPPADGGVGEFNLSGSISPCTPAYCQEFDADTSVGLRSDPSASVADDFMSADNTTVTFVCILGDYDSTGPAPGPTNFTVRYLADNAGVPGALIASFDSSNGLVLEGPVATGAVVEGNYTQFAHKLSHPPVGVAAGVRYWVEVRNLGSTFYWSSSAEGNGVSFQDYFNNGYQPADALPLDLAMCVGPIETCPFDGNNDGQVNFTDLNGVISSFNTPCP